MKTSTKIKTFLIIVFVAIFVVIAARHFIGLHFKKKFSIRPAPGVIVTTVEKSNFYKSIETFGTAIARNSKTYRVKKDDIVGLSACLKKNNFSVIKIWNKSSQNNNLNLICKDILNKLHHMIFVIKIN